MQACFWQPSRLLLQARMLAGFLAICAVTASGLSAEVSGGLVALCTVWLAGQYGQLRARPHPRHRRGLRHDRLRGWQLWRPDTGWRSVRVLSGSLVSHRLMVIRYRYPGRLRSIRLAVPFDVLDADAHRRMRVHLRFMTMPDPAAVWFPVLRAGGRGSQG